MGFDAPEAAADGGLAIKPLGRNQLEAIRVSGQGEFIIRRPFKVRGGLVACEAFHVEGQRLVSPVCYDTVKEIRVEPADQAVRYVLRFDSRR